MLHKHNIFNGVWAIEPGFSDNQLPRIVSFLKGSSADTQASEINPLTIHTQSSSSLGSSGDDSNNESYIAVISISGVITKHSQFCGPAGMVKVASILEECFASDDITGILLHVESGGGEFMAMRLMDEALAKKNKPVVGFIDDYACSAAAGIVFGCDYVVANSKMARVGSLGTYTTIADFSKKLEKEGIDVKEVYATDSKHKNGEVREALKGNLKPLQELTDKYNDYFMDTIESNREGKLTESREVWGTGKVYFADEALKLGLIDKIDTFNNTLNYFVK